MTQESENVVGWKVIRKKSRAITGWRIVSRDMDHNTPLYRGMHKLICKLAWRYSSRCMLGVEDLINEGYLALLGAQEKYDPCRASRSTFVYWVVRNHYCQLAKRWPVNRELSISDLIDNSQQIRLEEGSVFREIIQTLSTEAKDMIKLILQCPQEICELSKNRTPQCMQKVLTKILVQQGWIRERIVVVMQEISLSLSYNNKEEK